MERKFLITIVIAVLLIVVGGILIITNPMSGDVSGDSLKVPLKAHDFKLFEIDTPVGSKFSVKNENDGMKYYQNNGNHSDEFSGIIINKNLTDSLIGDNSEPISNATNENIYSFTLKNKTNYKVVVNKDDADVILIGEDLNLLKEISESVKIKDIENL